MRRHIDWRSSSKQNYEEFCDKHPSIKLTFDEWRSIIYTFNESFKEYILETGEKAKFPFGFGEFSINKKKRKKVMLIPKRINGEMKEVEFINLAIDWPKTREKHKLIYNFNFHTEGYFFGWMWFKNTARIKFSEMWYFKPSRATSRLLAHYIKINPKYQQIYHEWKGYNEK